MKLLIALMQELGGRVSAIDMHGYLFLLCHEAMENNHYYDFIPQPQGPYSLQAQADKQTLIQKKCLQKSDDWGALDGVERFATSLDFFEKMALQELKNTWQYKPSEEIHSHIKASYSNYFPPVTTEIKSQETQFFTIGYEGLSPEAYLNKLLANDVKLLCDVRKNAFSQKFGFSKKDLKHSLGLVGIGYQHIPELGIISEKRQTLNTDQDYKRLFDEYEQGTLINQQPSLDLLISLLKQHQRIAITCFEADVHYCHRSRVAKALASRDDFPGKVKHL